MPAGKMLLLAESSDSCFLCDPLQTGDVGSTLVVGEVGSDMSNKPLSNMDDRFAEGGELGAEDDVNSDGLSERRDQRPYGVIEMVDAESFGVWPIKGVPSPRPICHWFCGGAGDDGQETWGGVKVPEVSACLLFLGFFCSGL